MKTELYGTYHGRSKPLFALYCKTAVLTALTLGVYRFWAKTRIRKYIWSAISADDDGFEYTGTGLEKFLGFLVALVILAVYLGAVSMILVYLGLSFEWEPESEAEQIAQVAFIYANLLAAAPLIYFARYRARRYRMARSRWRGLRFGMDNGAWGYVARAIGFALLNGVTLGILSPFGTFYLEKYQTDRTWYGDARFVQNGQWTALFAGMKHIFIALGIMLVFSIIAAISGSILLFVATAFIGQIWLLIGLVHYRVFAFNYLTKNKVLDGEITMAADVQTPRVVKNIFVGYLVASVAFAAIMGVVVSVLSAYIFWGDGLPTSPAIGLSVLPVLLMYGLAALITGGLVMVMVTQPIIEHVVERITVYDPTNHLDRIRQRSADLGADAEGFADALDVGGAL